MKKIILFVIAYFVITMAWAYPWHMHWFHELYVAWGAFQRPEPVMLLGMAAILTQGVVIAYLYPYYNKGLDDKKGLGNPILRGIRFNLIVGLMTYSAMGFATAAKFNIDPIVPFLVYHSVFQLIQFTLTGAALGLIFGPASHR